MDTFESVFGDSGNLSELNFQWHCEKCEAKLNFELLVVSVFDIPWTATCCEEKYVIAPYIAAYYKEE